MQEVFWRTAARRVQDNKSSPGKPATSSWISLAPRLQPGAKRYVTTSNRFNGLAGCAEAVENGSVFTFVRNHRAEAAVLMRRAIQGMNCLLYTSPSPRD